MFYKKNDVKFVYIRFLHTNSSLMYRLNSVKCLTNLVHDIFFKSYVITDVSKSQKNRQIVLVCFIKKSC